MKNLSCRQQLETDEEIIAGYINENPGKMKWIFAPHETDGRMSEDLLNFSG
jgi:hypothetical protein